jgi:TetR/AcrR family transcriptional repressor of nem operon
MARPRGFAEEKVLDAAAGCFWQAGFSATSLRDLTAATGLNAPSLYNAFGDKEALFLRCLDRYLDGHMRARIARLEATRPPREAIEAFLAEIVARSIEDPRGCLLVNTAVEAAPLAPAVAQAVAARLAELEGFLLRCVRAGQREDRIARRPPRDLARLLLTTVMGLRVLARAGADAATLRGAARQALALLDPPAPETRR